MEIDTTPAFEISSAAGDSSLTKSKKKKKKDKDVSIGEKQAESTFRVEPSEKPAAVSYLLLNLLHVLCLRTKCK